MATAKKTARKTSSKSSAKKSGAKKSAARKTSAKKAPAKTSAAKKSAAKNSGGSVRKGVKTSASTARKTGVKRTNVTQYKQQGAKRTKMNSGEAKSKKESLIKQKRSTGSGPACWPGFERVAGKEAGSKGSCKPKANKSQGQKKEDAREAAGRKLRKAGGNKAKANRSR